MSLTLQEFGIASDTVEDGRQAVEACERRDYDLILMDMQMPVLDGLTAVRRIRDREGARSADRTPILVVSANALPEHVAASLAAGADGHLSKPITAARLMTAVSKAVQAANEASSAPRPASA